LELKEKEIQRISEKSCIQFKQHSTFSTLSNFRGFQSAIQPHL